jgi:hypothetical protein
MFEWWLERRWPRVEAEFAGAENLTDFMKVWDGPTLTRNAQRMPRDRLEQYLQDGVSAHIRSVIERELTRRSIARGTKISIAIAGVSFIISIFALVPAW